MKTKVKVKICGITNAQDAKLAEEQGAAYIGLNFAKCSPRHVTIAQAKTIITALNQAIPVGVFVQQTAAEIQTIVQELQLPMIQLYDRLTLTLAKDNIQVIQSIRVKSPTDIQRMTTTKAITMQADYYLLDSYSDNSYGGTGHTFNWENLPTDLSKVFLAGGININNVAQASRYQPYALDVCSSVESQATPRQKDHPKLTAFMQEVKRYAT